MKRRGVALIVALIMLSLPLATAMAAAFTIGVPVSYTSSTSVTIDQSGWYYIEAWGGNGGSSPSKSGGQSQPVRGYFYLAAGETIYVQVGAAGGNGNNNSGTSGGSAGAGASGAHFGSGHSGGKGGNGYAGSAGGDGGGGGGAASGVLKGTPSVSNIIIASGGGGGGGGGASVGQAGGAGGNSDQSGIGGGSASNAGSGNSSDSTNGYNGGWARHDGQNAAFGTLYGGGGAGGGGGGFNGAIGGGGKSGGGGERGFASAEGGGGGAGGNSNNSGQTSAPTGVKTPSQNSRTTGANGQVYITLLANEYTVLFEDGDGTGGARSTISPYKINAYPGDSNAPYLPATVATPTHSNGTFKGYYSAASGGDQYYDASGDRLIDWDLDDTTLTLYAQYNLKPTVTTVGATPTGTSVALSGSYVGGDTGYEVTVRGFGYRVGTSGAFTEITATDASGALSATVNGLAIGSYEYYAFVIYGDSDTKLTGDTETFDIIGYSDLAVALDTVTPSHSSANLNGSYSFSGTGDNYTITSAGFEYKLPSDPSWTSVPATGTSTPFSADVSGLSPLTTYDVRAFVKYNDGSAQTEYSADSTFTTLASPTTPTVDTLPVTDITKTTATFHSLYAMGNQGDLYASGGFEYRIYNATTPATWDDAVGTVDRDSGTSTFNMDVTGLAAGTEYEVRAYIIADNASKYRGNIVRFITTSLPEITAKACAVTGTTADFSGTYTDGDASHLVTGGGFEYRLLGDTAYTDVSSTAGSGALSGSATIGVPGTYEYRAYINYGSGEVLHTTIETFVIAKYNTPVPTVTVQSYTHNTADLQGEYTISGAGGNTPTIISTGFRYKLTSASDSDWSSNIPSGVTTSPFTHTISGLAPDTDYDVQSFVTYSDGVQSQTVYSATTKFKTDVIPLIPTVSTGDVTDLTVDDATLNGSYTLGQGASAGTFVSSAFQIRLYVDGMGAEDGWSPAYSNPTAGSPFTYSLPFIAADAGKLWQVRALLTYFDGTQNQTIVGDNKGFTQPKMATIVTLPATNITHASARLNASYTAGIGEAYDISGVRFYLRKVGETSWGTALIVTDVNSISSNGFFLDVSSLLVNTQYEYYAELLYGTSNTSLTGSVLNFTTKVKPSEGGDYIPVLPPIIQLPPKTGSMAGMGGVMLLTASMLLGICSKRRKYTK